MSLMHPADRSDDGSRPQLFPRGDAISDRALAVAKLTGSERRRILNGQTWCHICSCVFDMFRAPDMCGDCKHAVCTKCSVTMAYMGVLLGEECTVCDKCWPGVRVCGRALYAAVCLLINCPPHSTVASRGKVAVAVHGGPDLGPHLPERNRVRRQDSLQQPGQNVCR